MTHILPLQSAMDSVRFLCYSPSQFNPLEGQKVPATRDCLLPDLNVLRHLVAGLITYGLDDGLEQIPEIALQIEPPFLAVIPGIWDIFDSYEIEQAIRLVRSYPDLIVALCCGNEGIYFERYSRHQLDAVIKALKKELPEVCITSSEPLIDPDKYVLLECPIDFHFPTIHPWFIRRHLGPASADWVIQSIEELHHRTGLPVLCKETGWPSGGDPAAGPEAQQEFWQRLLQQTENTKDTAYALFEAFDAGPWKIITNEAPVEIHWGLFDSTRHPKPVAKMLESLRNTAR